MPSVQNISVNSAFSKQSLRYDEEDLRNPVLQRMRSQVYEHVERFLRPQSKILELNAGTGIDATYFTTKGHRVHATDLSDGMIREIRRKIESKQLHEQLTIQQLSFDQLDRSDYANFNFVFSNFGGLNCIADLRKVTVHLPDLITPGAYITFVIMPVVCPWEIAGMITHPRSALRRFNKNGVIAHLEGEYFTTYYHTFANIKNAFDTRFKLIDFEGLAPVSAQPHRGDFPLKCPTLDRVLLKADRFLRKRFPFNRWADHLIVTFQYQP